MDTQKNNVRDKELSQQTYSALVEKYQTEKAAFAKEIEHLNGLVKERAKDADAFRRERN
jgi:hypothetical protein